MNKSLKNLGTIVRESRLERKLSQKDLAEKCPIKLTQTIVTQLETGKSAPNKEQLTALCEYLEIQVKYWQPFTHENSMMRIEFEDLLSEFVGKEVSIENLDDISANTAENEIVHLFKKTLTSEQTFDTFNRCLTFYGIKNISKEFFEHFLKADAFRSMSSFKDAVIEFQSIAIRLFSSFSSAFKELNNPTKLGGLLDQITECDPEPYRKRTEWDCIKQIEDERLPDLGYISAVRIEKENSERKNLQDFLLKLANDVREDDLAVARYSESQLRKMYTLMRKFGSTLQHGMLSPMFRPDPNALEREAYKVGPRKEDELNRIAETQKIAMRNLSNYLTADYLDVYVATSMRSDADFVSVSNFVTKLFKHSEIEHLKLRYFNPTQSWIEDRVAKGLVEALMLHRANFTIYMSQKEDTFGKDSEASVSLGQGKPVIVYVPKLIIPKNDLNIEELSLLNVDQLKGIINKVGLSDFDEGSDKENLLAILITNELQKLKDEELELVVKIHWADFDLYGEAERIKDENLREEYRNLLDYLIGKKTDKIKLNDNLRKNIISILVATSVRFERRAHTFREVHPLALQVILSTGVLNGIHVVRSVDICAKLLRKLITNKLSVKLIADDDNYRLIETDTNSTIRVISKNPLIKNAYNSYYK